MAKPVVFLVLSTVLFFTNITVVFAAAGPVTKACPDGFSGNPPGKAVFPLKKENVDGIKAYLKKVSCANACFDETVTIEIGANIVLTTSSINKCPGINNPSYLDAAKAGRGCDKKDQPQIAVVVPANLTGLLGLKQPKIGPKSRCYDDFATTLDKMFNDIAEGTLDPADLKKKLEALNDLGT